MRKEEKISEDWDARLYLDDCIDILERELFPEKFKPQTMRYDPELIPKFKTMGYDAIESEILSYLCCSQKPVTIADLQKLTGHDRGKLYRVCHRFESEEIVTKTGISLTRYSIKNREKPFDAIVKIKLAEAKKFSDFTI